MRAELRDERGSSIGGLDDPAGGTFDAAGDIDRLLPLADAAVGLELPDLTAFRLLKYVDPYGDTMFNQPQMSDILGDIALVADLRLTPIEQRGLDRLRAMAERCRDSTTHLYLWFVGD